MNRRHIGATILLVVGLPFTYLMATAALDHGWDWFQRTGYVGLFFATAMTASGIYSLLDCPYELVLRVAWTVWFAVLGGGILLLVLIGIARTGRGDVFLAVVLVSVSVFFLLAVSTALDVREELKK